MQHQLWLTTTTTTGRTRSRQLWSTDHHQSALECLAEAQARAEEDEHYELRQA